MTNQLELQRARAGRRGGALLFSLIVLSVIAVLASASFQLTMSSARRQKGSIQTRSAFYTAEAGLAEGYLGLLQGRSGNVGSEQLPTAFGGGMFWVEATDLGDGLVELESHSRVRGAQAILSVVAERGALDVASLGVFSASPLTLPEGSVIDAYDATAGGYFPGEGIEMGYEARLGSNGPVTILGDARRPTKVHGDVISGPADVVTITGDVELLGETGSAYRTVALPPVVAPERPSPLPPPATPSGGTPLVLVADAAAPSSLTVNADQDATLVGPGVFVFDTLQVDPLGALHLDSSAGPLTIFVKDTLQLSAGADVETITKFPRDVTILVEGALLSDGILTATGQFQGTIYAPQARLVMGPRFELFGSAVANELHFNGPAQLHFDTSLHARSEENSKPQLVSWRILDLGGGDGGRALAQVDPFEEIGIARNAMPRPAEAHEVQPLDIVYVDATDTVRTYVGLESGFDWTAVTRLLSGERGGVVFKRPVDPVIKNPSPTVDEKDVVAATSIEDEWIAIIHQDPPLGSGELADLLERGSPLADIVLLQLFMRDPWLNASDLERVLVANPQAGENVRIRAINQSLRLPDSNLVKVMEAMAPLSPRVKDALSNRSPGLELVDLLRLLGL